MEANEAESLAEIIAELEPEERERVLAGHASDGEDHVRYVWEIWERPGQSEPPLPWRTWLVMAGRGFGKTRMGAEWVRRTAAAHPQARIALVGATMAQARAVMVEGDSGLLAVCPDEERPVWEPSLNRLRFPGGALAFVYTAAEPEGLRGPQHHFAWCDEIAKWPFGPEAWDNLMFGLRRGALPRAMATTTPRPVALVRKLYGRERVKLTRGRMIDNSAHLSAAYIADVRRDYEGTRLGRQELDGDLIDDVEGSLWPRELIERNRAPFHPMHEAEGEGEPDGGEGEPVIARSEATRQSCLDACDERGTGLPRFARNDGFRRVIVGVDPPASAEGTCGIVVCGLGSDGLAYVLADATVGGVGPEKWARAVEGAAAAWGADRVVAEGNQGGAMVEAVLRGADVNLPIRRVHAKDGKSARAEPVAALFEAGRAKFAGAFPELEDQLAGLIVGGGYEGPGRSPDRADAMVWGDDRADAWEEAKGASDHGVLTALVIPAKAGTS